jgi:hypothetical protein
VLVLLSRGYEPIPPLHAAKAARPEDIPADGRKDRVYQISCRRFRAPAFELRNRAD